MMLSFLLAVFGGAYIVGRCVWEKSTVKENNADREQRESRARSWLSKHSADSKLKEKTVSYIKSGEHFDEICELLKDDFKYIYGKEWRAKVNIATTVQPRSNHRGWVYNSRIPMDDSYWVYHLVLAHKGKIDYNTIDAYRINPDTRARDTRFLECIEGALLNAGVRDAMLVLEMERDNSYSKSDIYNNKVIFDVCRGIYPTRRLWDDYVGTGIEDEEARKQEEEILLEMRYVFQSFLYDRNPMYGCKPDTENKSASNHENEQ